MMYCYLSLRDSPFRPPRVLVDGQNEGKIRTKMYVVYHKHCPRILPLTINSMDWALDDTSLV